MPTYCACALHSSAAASIQATSPFSILALLHHQLASITCLVKFQSVHKILVLHASLNACSLVFFTADKQQCTHEVCFHRLPGVGLHAPPRLTSAVMCRGLHTVTAVNQQLWLFGGAPKSGPMLQDLWVLDIPSMTWSQPQLQGSLPHPRCSQAAAALGAKIYLYGGLALIVCLQAHKGEDGSHPSSSLR